MALQRNTKVETVLSKAIHKLEVAKLLLYSDSPFALRLMLQAEKDLTTAQISTMKSLGIKMKT
jgi:hypothetical protein